MPRVKKRLEQLFDPRIVPENKAGTSRELDLKARDFVVARFTEYDAMRTFTRGGHEFNVTQEWDEYYRIYKAIFNTKDHSYEGKAKHFIPELRKAVSVIFSEWSNAQFGREDYYAVVEEPTDNPSDMSHEAFQFLKHQSDAEGYVDHFEQAAMQCLIYGCTAVENVFLKQKIDGLYRKLDRVPVVDPETGEALVDPKTGEPVPPRKEYNIYKIEEDRKKIRIEVRDIYRLYINHLSNNPEQEDMIYQDSMTTQELLEYKERGIYNAEAVDRLVKMTPSSLAAGTAHTQMAGEGKTYLASVGGKITQAEYEVLRFQGLFTTENETTGEVLREQFWIDLGERNEVLRLSKNPLLGGYKTLSFTSYDTMFEEAYSDSVISPNKSIQYEINDKENQSVDGLTFELNAPFEVLNGSGITAKDIIETRKKANKALFVNERDSVRKITTNPPLNHLNSELARLSMKMAEVTGATSLAAGAPTGTQADRSGKALGILQAQTRSQFSKFVRKFERQLITQALQKTWDMMVQFFDEELDVEVFDTEKNTMTTQKVSLAEVTGMYRIKVDAGSQYLKERERRDSIMEFLSICQVSDEFIMMLKKDDMLRDIAAAMPFNMEKYVDPNNLFAQYKQMIQNLQNALQATGQQNSQLMGEVKRLVGVIKQTDRATEASPPVTEQISQGGGQPNA